MEHESSSTSSSTSDFSYGSNSPSTITHKRNSGRKKFKETRHPIYQGVRQRNGGKWVCEMRVPNSKNNSRLWLGTHDTPEMAARAYDVAALALKGKSAQLNFDDSVWVLQRAKSSSLSDIRSAAHEAAHSFRSTSTSSPLSPNSSVVLPAQSPENIDSIFSPSSNSSIFSHVESPENVVETSTMFVYEEASMMFLDEEAMFNMPTLLASMAEGMLLTPPALQTSFCWDDFDYNTQDLSLWID